MRTTPCMRSGYGFCTLPALRQEVHTWIRFGAPLTTARIFCTLGFQRRFVRRCEWLKRMPNCGFLPHTSHTEAMTEPRCNAGKALSGTVKGSSQRCTIPAVPVLEELGAADLRRV